MLKICKEILYIVILCIATQLFVQGCVYNKVESVTKLSEYKNGLQVINLKCENRINPLGIDATNPKLNWLLNSKQRNQKQTAYHILVASSEENLSQNIGDVWDSGKVDSQQNIQVTYNGVSLKSGARYFWKVRVWDKNGNFSRWSQIAWWEMALLDSKDWKGVWINDGKPMPQQDEDFYRDDPAPLFRKEFDLKKNVKKARLYISGLGYYEAFLNGKRIGDHLLDPGWTTYSKRIFYSTYDVTENIHNGQNCASVILGNGWYNPLPMKMWGWVNLREHLTIGKPRFIAQLNIEYEDGTKQSVVSDQSWKVGESPIIKNNIYLGETYDAGKEQPGWNLPGFDDSFWNFANNANEVIDVLQAQPQPPIRATRTIKPVKLTQLKPNVYIFDMGQNFAGWVKMRVKGEAGTTVKLRYGELLYPDSTLNGMTAVAGQIKKTGRGGPGAPDTAWQKDTYILKGEGDEEFVPRFTFHGFRYVEVTGFPGEPTLNTIEGMRLNSDVKSAASFSCSNPLFNRINEMTRWTFLSNLFSVQSDCPQREKFGYGGDIVPTCEAFMLNFDMTNFYQKVLQDFSDAARPNNGLTETAPFVGIHDEGFGGGSGPIGWGLAHLLLQDKLYQYYGFSNLLEEHYETARKWIDFLQSKAKNHIIEIGISDHESLDPKPTALTSTAFYYYHVQLLSRQAEIIGRKDDAKKYAKLAQEIKEGFITKFLNPGTGQFGSHTQASQSVALYFDLVPREEKQAAINVLLDEIFNRHKGHLATGIFGTKYMLDVLTRNGRADVAYTIVNQKTFPGWGYMLEKGATTLWEHWEFSDNTYSHNHPMFGSVSEWFIKTIAGINPHPEAVGFDRIIIKPQIVGDLTWAKASYSSIRGLIVCDWKINGKEFKLKVEIPVNTTARIYIPTREKKSITENGKSVNKIADVKFVEIMDGVAVFDVGSGEHSFQSVR